MKVCAKPKPAEKAGLPVVPALMRLSIFCHSRENGNPLIPL